ncbi:unnamed protein product [Cyprideis torosa]|uniref:Uncharacterized protein n=1 Tax=Cyprideis torosa TaxID=163714 RepID=A0A7R8W894_9CRUS|nr:unnamed protein product [Cyprideis torosa]CAG0888359.1 unnamed protein product [Cyprideis torosa]
MQSVDYFSGSSRRGSARNIRFLSTRPTIRLVPQRTIQVQTLPASGEDHDIPPIYGYRYEIRAPEYQTYIQAEEQRDNDYTQGSYSWVDADGNLHTTTYYADATGYHPTHTVTPNAGLPR